MQISQFMITWRFKVCVVYQFHYASRMGSWWIIFFSIVGQQVLCGMPYLPGLVFAGLCLARSRRFLLAGSWVVAQGALLFGKWFIFVLRGVFGGSAMIDVLRTLRSLVRSSSIFFFLPSSLGFGLACPMGD